jgi:hypothetical protein
MSDDDRVGIGIFVGLTVPMILALALGFLVYPSPMYDPPPWHTVVVVVLGAVAGYGSYLAAGRVLCWIDEHFPLIMATLVGAFVVGTLSAAIFGPTPTAQPAFATLAIVFYGSILFFGVWATCQYLVEQRVKTERKTEDTDGGEQHE